MTKKERWNYKNIDTEKTIEIHNDILKIFQRRNVAPYEAVHILELLLSTLKNGKYIESGE